MRTFGSVAIVAFAVVTLLGAAQSARRAYGMPFPSVPIGADGGFATLFLPGWGTARAPIRHGDLVVAVDGVAVSPRHHELPGPAAYRIIAARHRAGARRVTIDYLQRGTRRQITLPLRTLGALDLWFFLGITPLAACINLASGLLVRRLASSHPASRAYMLWCLANFTALSTTLDYVTLARMQPLNPVAVFTISIASVWTASAFPRALRGVLWPWVARAVLAVLACLTLWAATRAMTPDQHTLRLTMNVVGLFGVLVLAISLVVRVGIAPRDQRAPILAVTWILTPVPVFFAALIASAARGNDALHLGVPFVFLAVPIAVDFAIMRHNVLEVPALLARKMLLVPTTLWALLVGGVAAWGVRALQFAPGTGLAVPALAALGAVGVVLLFARWMFEQLYFSAASRFRATVLRLSEQLASLTDRASIKRAVEDHVTQLLGTPGAVVSDDPSPPTGADARGLSLPMRCQTGLEGVLSVPPRASLYTRDDLILLDAVASLGALALHHATVVHQLDALRRAEVGATREDRDLAVGLLSAEVSHEVAYSLNYFRFLLRRAADGHAPGADDIDVGQEEIARLERMLVSLRRAEVTPLRREPVTVVEPIGRALGLLRDDVRALRVDVTLDVPRELVLVADHDALVQIFANLLRNGLHAAEGGRVGVRATEDPDAVTLDVWDTGPGVPPELAERIFTPWVTTRSQGLGLGLAITERLTRALGWSITLLRVDGETIFRLRAPRAGTAGTDP